MKHGYIQPLFNFCMNYEKAHQHTSVTIKSVITDPLRRLK